MFDMKYLKITFRCCKCGCITNFVDCVAFCNAQEVIEKQLPKLVCAKCEVALVSSDLDIALFNSKIEVEIKEISLLKEFCCSN